MCDFVYEALQRDLGVARVCSTPRGDDRGDTRMGRVRSKTEWIRQQGKEQGAGQRRAEQAEEMRGDERRGRPVWSRAEQDRG